MSEKIAKLKIEDLTLAEMELHRFAENCGIRLTTPDEKTDKTERDFYRRVVNLVMTGELTIEEDGTGVYHMKKPPVPAMKTVTFDEPDGVVMRALDVMEKQGNFTGMQAFIAAHAKQSLAVIGKVKKRDLDPLTDIATLFLG